jgi:hypothetical protein
MPLSSLGLLTGGTAIGRHDEDNSKRGSKVPKPPNAWILYRSASLSQMSRDGTLVGRKQAELSKIIAERWRSESLQVRRRYECEAEHRKLEHGPDSPGQSVSVAPAPTAPSASCQR